MSVRTLVGIIWVFGALALLFLFQLTRIFSIFGVAPALSFVFLLFLAARRTPLRIFIPALAWFFVLSFLWTPFWMVEMGIAAAIALAGYFLAPFLLTGNRCVDVALLTIIGTLLYAAVGSLFGFLSFTWRIPVEVVYNALVGFLLVAVFMEKKKGSIPLEIGRRGRR